MSADLKAILHNTVEEYRKRREIEIEEGMARYKSLMLKLADEKKIDVAITIEGIQQKDQTKEKQDLELLESARLVEGQNKFTHRTEYRQYSLTLKGIELSEKLLREEE